MVHNQFVEVPSHMTHSLESYFLHRGELMQKIEQDDIEQRKLENRNGRITNSMGALQTQVAVAASVARSSRRANRRRTAAWLALDLGGIVGLSRSGLFLCLAGHQGPLQADRHRRGLGGSAAGADHAGL